MQIHNEINLNYSSFGILHPFIYEECIQESAALKLKITIHKFGHN